MAGSLDSDVQSLFFRFVPFLFQQVKRQMRAGAMSRTLGM
jgi:hypothetical protein